MMVKSVEGRRVHGVTVEGRDVVRYERAGKWYIEHPGGKRKAVSLAEAADALREEGSVWHRSLPGGARFDRLVKQFRSI